MTHSELERAAYISGQTQLAQLHAKLDDAELTIDQQAADLDNLRYQLAESADMLSIMGE